MIKNFCQKVFSSFNNFFLILIAFGFATAILALPESSKIGIINGINFCGNILIPSLFPFVFLSNFIIKSGIAEKIGSIFKTACNFIFNLPGETSSVILLSFIGGYPVGAVGISALLKNKVITNDQAEQMLSFCVCAGPGFIVNFIGLELIHNQKIATIIYISQIVSGLLMGTVLGIISRINSRNSPSKKFIYQHKKRNIEHKNAFIKSCSAATTSIITMSSLVILFSCLISIINDSDLNFLYQFVPKNVFMIFVSSLLEVTNSCIEIAKLDSNLQMLILSFTIGFAGLSVHMQISSEFEKFNYGKFIISRIIHGLFSAIITKILLTKFIIDKPVFSNINTLPNTKISTTTVGSGLIILLSFFFIFTLEGEKPKNYELVAGKLEE